MDVSHKFFGYSVGFAMRHVLSLAKCITQESLAFNNMSLSFLGHHLKNVVLS